MSRSGSLSSACSLESLHSLENHPRLKGVYPPAPQTAEGLVTSSTASTTTSPAAASDSPNDEPVGHDLGHDPETTEFTEEAPTHQLLGDSFEVISIPSSSEDGGDDAMVAAGLLCWHFTLPVLLILSGTALVLSYQVLMQEALSLEKEDAQLVDTYTMLLFATFWPALFFWVVVLVWELLGRRKWTSLPAMALWLVILTAGTSAVWMLVFIFATGEERTPQNFQGILAVAWFIVTPIVHWLVTGRRLNWIKCACFVAVSAGLLITTIPQVIGVGYTGDHKTTSSSRLSRILWSVVYTLGFAVLACSLAFFERTVRWMGHMPTYFAAYLTTFQFFALLSGFWLDFIPVVGLADSIREFWQRVEHTVLCSFGQEPLCSSLIPYTWIFICIEIIFTYTLLLFVRKIGTTPHAVVVCSEILPLVALFWSLLVYCEVPLEWDPDAELFTWLALGGVVILLIPMVLYGHKVRRESVEEHGRAMH